MLWSCSTVVVLNLPHISIRKIEQQRAENQRWDRLEMYGLEAPGSGRHHVPHSFLAFRHGLQQSNTRIWSSLFHAGWQVAVTAIDSISREASCRQSTPRHMYC